MKILQNSFGAAALFMVLTTASPVHAQAGSPVLASSDKSPETVSVADLEAEALRIPVEQRAALLSRPESVAQIATTLYVRRALAAQAMAEGLADAPATAAALRLARETVLADAMLDKRLATNPASDANVETMARNMYVAQPNRFFVQEQVHVRHILISEKQTNAKGKAEEVLAQLRGGADFEKLAAERSEDPGSARRGGDLGFFGHRAMVPEFEQAAFSLKNVGDLSEPVKTQFGYHVLELRGKREAGVRPFEEVRETLVQQVRASMEQQAKAAAIKQAEAEIKLNAKAITEFAASQPGKP